MTHQTIISIQNLHKSYAKKMVLQGINLEIERGQIIGYIGPNGAGKSTTIKILTGLLPDFAGDIKVLGYDLRVDALEIKRRVGYVPENATLYEVLTPMEYLLFLGRLHQMPDELIERRAMELLEIFDLQHQADLRMNTFSKGMRQKVLLIAGLIHNPEILFLDEPLSGLDANAVILVKEVLLKLRDAGKTIFYSSHIMDVVEKISDRIILINQGTVIADGTFDDLKQFARNDSLESIFQDLTGNSTIQRRADDFLNALR
ncbi:MAG: ABC transporter ATP-binding protein [Runella sp.]